MGSSGRQRKKIEKEKKEKDERTRIKRNNDLQQENARLSEEVSRLQKALAKVHHSEIMRENARLTDDVTRVLHELGQAQKEIQELRENARQKIRGEYETKREKSTE